MMGAQYLYDHILHFYHLAALDYDDEVKDLLAKLSEGRELLNAAIAAVKEQPGSDYMDLYGRQLTDIAIDLIVGYLFCSQASTKVEIPKVAIA